MTPEMWIVLFILAAAIVLFVTEWLRVDIVALTVVVALMVSGILGPGEALSGFSNSAVLTIAALFVVGGAVLNTGLAGMIADSILKIAGNRESRLIGVIMGSVGTLSGFISDTGVVALMLPAITSLANRSKINPSRLLIPLTYGSLLGGASTLIGTPPNLIVTELLAENGLRPFSFFSFTPMGLTLMLTGILFMVLVGRRILPDRAVRREVQDVETPEELLRLYRLPDSLFRLRVRRSSKLVGQTLSASDLRRDFGINVLEIARPAQPRTVARIASQKIMIQAEEDEHLRPGQDFTLETNDILIVQGEPSEISRAAARWSLSIQPAESADQESLISGELGIAEVVLPPRSSLIGKTLRDVQFGARFRLTVLNIHRPGAETIDLKTSRLQFGDTLLVQGEWADIERLRRMRRDFVVLGTPELVMSAQNRKKAPLALAILLGMLVLVVGDFAPILTASMLAALLMVLSGCLSMDDAYGAIEWKSLVMVAGMLPMAAALEKVGLVELAAEGFAATLGGVSPMLVLAGFFLLTSIFSQVLSNTATTVLVAPIALATALQLGVAPYTFLLGVAVAASTPFASPVGSASNTLVMGAGNYRFSDYAKVGAPLILISMVLTTLILPVFFPF